MQELFNAAFSSVNIFPTILLLVILAYWLFVIVGALDMDFLNVEVDTGDIDVDIDANVDVEADIDMDGDLDADADLDTDTGDVLISMNSILGFFNLGKVPFMLLLSFFILPMWIISILTNHIIHNQSLFIALLLLIPNIILSLVVSKVLTTPFAILYTRMIKNNDAGFKYAGKMCKIILPASDNRIGQAEINHNNSTYRINVQTKEGTQIEKGESALVINYIENKKCYLVEPYKI